MKNVNCELLSFLLLRSLYSSLNLSFSKSPLLIELLKWSFCVSTELEGEVEDGYKQDGED